MLSLRGIVKRWGDLEVLAGADLDVPTASRIWIGGRNGVGKTTLMRIAAGLIKPEAGTIALDGLDPERDRRRFQSQVGFLSAGNTGLYARLSVRHNLAFWASISFVPRGRRAAVIDATIARFELEELEHRRVDRLSMGQRQRVRLALAFLHSPRLALLDEPHTSLDDEALALLADVLDEHRASGGAAILCAPSHQHLQVEVNRSYLIEQGKLVRA